MASPFDIISTGNHPLPSTFIYKYSNLTQKRQPMNKMFSPLQEYAVVLNSLLVFRGWLLLMSLWHQALSGGQVSLLTANFTKPSNRPTAQTKWVFVLLTGNAMVGRFFSAI